MLMNINCSMEPQIAVNLEFDDGSTKTRVIGKGDLVSVTFNQNGIKQYIEGRIVNVSTNSDNLRNWFIMIDGSECFDSKKFRFSPLCILDLDIICKANVRDSVKTPNDNSAIWGLREVDGKLQYSKDGFNWYNVVPEPENAKEDTEKECTCNCENCKNKKPEVTNPDENTTPTTPEEGGDNTETTNPPDNSDGDNTESDSQDQI